MSSQSKSNSMWFEELALLRAVNRSNVILVETADPKRLEQLITALQKGLLSKGNREYRYIYRVNIQLNEISTILGEPINYRGPISKFIIDKARSNASIFIIYWLLTKEHVMSLLNLLVGLAQDPKCYIPKSELMSKVKLSSTIIAFISSLELLPSDVRKLLAEVRVTASTPEERKALINELVNHYRMFFNVPNVPVDPNVVDASSGLTLHETENAVLESLKLHNAVKAEVFTKYKVEMLRQYGLEYIIPDEGFEVVGGYKHLKQYVRDFIIEPLKNPELARYYGESLPRGFILYGYPGTGKSWFVRAMAREVGLPMIKLSAADFLRGIVGETEARTRRIINLLESLAPCIVFIDEIDQLFLARGQIAITDSGVSRRLQNMLLDWLGDPNRRTFVVGATNYVEQMDFAALRSGRFDEIILVLPPDYEARKEIFRIHLEVINKPKVPVKVDYDELARATWMWTGADIATTANVVKKLARKLKAKAITTELVKKVITARNININERENRVREMISVAEKLEIINYEFLNEAKRVFEEESKIAEKFSRVEI